MVRTLSSNTGSAGLILGLGAKIHHASWPEKPQNINNINHRSNIVTNLIKTLKMVHIKTKIFKKKNKKLYLALICP